MENPFFKQASLLLFIIENHLSLQELRLDQKIMTSSALLSNGKPISESSSFRASKSLRVVLNEEEEKNNIEDSSKLAGILYKWVNFGKGWRPRWFVLKDGVFSYYKVHGPDKITFAPDRPIGGLRIVGDHSIRYFKKHCNATADEPKISGELHLQVRWVLFENLLSQSWKLIER